MEKFAYAFLALVAIIIIAVFCVLARIVSLLS
jgi:hypothetical protein